MEAAQKVIDDILKCSFCENKFSGAIKLVPECASSICEACHDQLREAANNSNEYTCRVCKESHRLPEKGLADNRALTKMLDSQKNVRPQNDKIESFKRQLKETQIRIGKLSSYDAQEEIDAYCSHLQKQVMDTIDAAFAHLNKLGNQLLEQIVEFRSSLVDSVQETNASKRFKNSETSTKQELEQLGNEVLELASASSFALSYSSDVLLKSLESSLSGFRSKVDHIEQKLKEKTFKGRQIKYKPNGDFCKSTDYLGHMVLEDSSKQNNTSECANELSSSKDNRALHILKGHKGMVFEVMFLMDGNLASSSDDRLIKIWNPKDGEMLYELFGSLKPVYAMVSLTSNLLASCSGQYIFIWDLRERKIINTLKGHERPVFSLKRLTNGNLVSASLDDTIKIWDPYRFGDNLLRTLAGHGDSKCVKIAITSSDQIATVSTNMDYQSGDNYLRIWSEENSSCLKSFPTRMVKASCLTALKHGFAIGYSCGSIYILDSNDSNRCFTMRWCHDRGVYSLLEAPNGNLISGGSRVDSTVKIWRLNETCLKLLQTIQTGHTHSVCSLALSQDCRYLATGSHDTTAQIIRMSSL